MKLPFDRAQFVDVFARYNEGVWPAQIVLYGVALACLALIAADRGKGRAIGIVLALLWAWMGLAYHLVYFTAINPLAWSFAAAFLVAGNAFYGAAAEGRLVFDRPRGAPAVVGGLIVLYALVGYPLLGRYAGDHYPSAPTFGVPCPTTIFTLGLLVFARRPVPAGVFVVPILWSIVGTTAALWLHVTADFGLPIAAALLLATHANPFRGRSAPTAG